MNAIGDVCKFALSPIAFISHERKQVVIQFLIENIMLYKLCSAMCWDIEA